MSIIEDSTRVRGTYLGGARALVQLLGVPALRDRWAAPSALDGWSCGLVAGHVARSVLQVEWFLDAEEPTVPTVTAVDSLRRRLRAADAPRRIPVHPHGGTLRSRRRPRTQPGVNGLIPDACIEEAAAVLEAVAFRHHGALAVLRALARRERDESEALRVL